MMRAIARLTRLICAAAFGIMAVTVRSAAQYQRQPIVLVHGFFAQGDDWGGTLEYFHDNLYANLYSWTLHWDQRFEDQSTTLRTQMLNIGLPDTTVLVAHSFGGLVARSATQHLAVKGILTIGSPHRGAPIAASIRNRRRDRPEKYRRASCSRRGTNSRPAPSGRFRP